MNPSGGLSPLTLQHFPFGQKQGSELGPMNLPFKDSHLKHVHVDDPIAPGLIVIPSPTATHQRHQANDACGSHMPDTSFDFGKQEQLQIPACAHEVMFCPHFMQDASLDRKVSSVMGTSRTVCRPCHLVRAF